MESVYKDQRSKYIISFQGIFAVSESEFVSKITDISSEIKDYQSQCLINEESDQQMYSYLNKIEPNE